VSATAAGAIGFAKELLGFAEELEHSLLGDESTLDQQLGPLGAETLAAGHDAAVFVLFELVAGQSTAGVVGVSVPDLGTASNRRDVGHDRRTVETKKMGKELIYW
jgi:hypothetical protein